MMESESLNIVDFKGSQSNPSIVITAALHGNEQTATYVADLLINRLENEKILGNCRIIHVCNETAFKNRQRRAPEDNEDLNRVFPGNLEGTFSERLASKIWEETKDFDYILDLHCCGIFGHLCTMCEYSESKDQYELCQQLGIKTVIHTAGTGGQFYLEAMRQRGQKSLLIEFPGGQPNGIIDLESAHDVLEKIINYLKIIGVIDGDPIDYGKVNLCGIIDKENIMTMKMVFISKL